MTIENTYNTVVFLKSLSPSLSLHSQFFRKQKRYKVQFINYLYTHLLMNEEGENEEEEKIIWTII